MKWHYIASELFFPGFFLSCFLVCCAIRYFQLLTKGVKMSDAKNNKQSKVKEQLIMQSPREFVYSWFERNRKGKIGPTGNFEGKSLDLLDTITLDHHEILLAYNIKNPAKKIKSVKENLIASALREYIVYRKNKALKKYKEQFVYKPENVSADFELQRWLTALVQSPTAVDLAVIKHFIWQVKRKMFKKKVTYHMFPVFFGPQGAGKSEAIKKLLQPLLPVTMEWAVNDSVDSRSSASFTDHFVCWFDEMSGIHKTEIEALKRNITAEEISYRPMYTNSTEKAPQNCTFLGVSNKALSEIIHDNTGYRRFYQFNCKTKVDWNIINSIDALAIWQSIDENQDVPFVLEHQEALATIQASYKYLEELEEYLIAHKIKPTDENTQQICSNALYEHYKLWRIEAGYTSQQLISKQYFGRRLNSFNIAKTEQIVDGVSKTFYSINAAATIKGFKPKL